MRVLVVEDEELLAAGLRNGLEAEGFAVDGAAYGVEIRRPDGSQVEVNLDENVAVIGQGADEDRAGER